MAQGKKTDNETIYKIMLSYYITRNYSQTGRDLGIDESTIRHIVKENINKEEFTKLYEQKKEEFVKNADRIINKGTELLERRLNIALDNQEELDDLIFEVYNASREDIKEQQKKSLVNKIMKMQINSLSEITTAIGTMYDKKRVAEGGNEQTGTPQVNINIVDNSELEKVLYEDENE